MSMLTDIARGMSYLHSHDPQIIHRDLKGSNALVTEFLKVKVADFGSSRIIDRGAIAGKQFTRWN